MTYFFSSYKFAGSSTIRYCLLSYQDNNGFFIRPFKRKIMCIIFLIRHPGVCVLHHIQDRDSQMERLFRSRFIQSICCPVELTKRSDRFRHVWSKYGDGLHQFPVSRCSLHLYCRSIECKPDCTGLWVNQNINR